MREAGLGSREELRVRWIVRGRGKAVIRYQAEKAADASREVEVR